MKPAMVIFREYLRKNGMLVSRQREQVLEIFLKTEHHPTITNLYDLVRKKNPKIGLATIYRTMKVICEAGLAREVDFGDGIGHFEHEYGHKHHDHLVCTQCGRVIEVLSPAIEEMQKKLAKKHNFTPSSHKMKIFGTCGKCKAK